MKLSEGKEQFLLDCRARRLTSSTVRCYDYNLRAFIGAVGDIEVESVTPAVIREHLVWMRKQVEQDGSPHYSECTVHHRYVGLRAFFKWMAREDLLEANPIAKVRAPRFQEPVIEPLSPQHLAAIIEVIGQSKDFVASRNLAMFYVMLDTGVRRTELASMLFTDLDMQTRRITIRASVSKNDRERRVFFGSTTARAVRKYLIQRNRKVFAGEQALWLGEHAEPITKEGVSMFFRNLRERLGLTGVRVSPHTVRHTFAQAYLRQHSDCFALQDILGHRTLAMTRRYVRRFSEDVERQYRSAPSPVEETLTAIKTVAGRTQGRRVKGQD